MEEQKKAEKTTEDKKKKRIKKIIGVSLFVLLFIVVAVSMRATPSDDESIDGETDVAEETTVVDDEDSDNDVNEEVVDGLDDDYVDERPGLEEGTLGGIQEEAYEYASNGQWNDLIILLDKYDKEFDLEKSEKGEHLQDIYWDAMIISRLEQMGDDENAIIAGVEKIPHLKTVEMYVWALYHLPRNNIVDLSNDSLALAPTARGKVNIIDVQNSQYDEDLYNEMVEDEYIKSYMNSVDIYNIEGDGYFKVELTNYGVNETVYGLVRLGGGYDLIGIYSNDEYYSNHVETVSHFRKFSEKVNAGVEAIEQDEHSDSLDDSNDELNEED